MPVRILEPASFRRMPWKNGAGETIEIAAFPEGADLSSFNWRVSMANVGADGPFSCFDGIDRTLCVIEGGRLGLAFDDQIVMLDTVSAPFAFAGDVPCHGTVPDGPIVDLNVMTRRGRCRHRVTRRADIADHGSVAPTVIVLAHHGAGIIKVAGMAIHLPEGHVALATDSHVSIQGTEGSILYLIEIEPA